jgi:nicotinamide riboside transporter PnuC
VVVLLVVLVVVIVVWPSKVRALFHFAKHSPYMDSCCEVSD